MSPNEKQCRCCKEEKLLSNFCNDKSRPDKLNVYCRKCVYMKKEKWKIKYPRRSKRLEKEQNARSKNYRWNYYLKKKYGIDQTIYYKMLEGQENKCAICLAPQTHYTRRFAVDHSHTSGKIRGLLCTVCNRNICGLIDRRAKSRYVQMTEMQFVEHIFNYYKKAASSSENG